MRSVGSVPCDARLLDNGASDPPVGLRGRALWRVAARVAKEKSVIDAAETTIHWRIAELAQDIETRTPEDIPGALDELARAAADCLPGAAHAGITVARKDTLDTAAATGPHPKLLDALQAEHRQGPGFDAVHQQRSVRVDDLGRDTRWPEFSSAATTQTPIRSLLSVPMVARRQILGVLTLCAEQPAAFDFEAVDIALIFASHAALAWNRVRRESLFRASLVSRELVGQAKGMLMERYRIGPEEAFSLLQRLSNESHTPVAELAGRLAEPDRRHEVLGDGGPHWPHRRPTTRPTVRDEAHVRWIREATRC